ncbi:hypothetical protein AXYL_06853 (plasmid) [Achromobacter xylosoxidans A8]|uniref:Uncharacterized protein n=1 Tax=Achromobacter xylosoxidans (strain A8) TaxID=762376 RepID=E3HYI1_ACHXA|nr:hypothetical protein AXYL_06853 [Achromobacter xylosoxidans A8]
METSKPGVLDDGNSDRQTLAAQYEPDVGVHAHASAVSEPSAPSAARTLEVSAPPAVRTLGTSMPLAGRTIEPSAPVDVRTLEGSALPAARTLMPSTTEAYARALTRIQRGVAHTGAAPSRPGYFQALVDWLVHHAPGIRPGTWMIRRAALRDYFARDGSPEALEADSRLEALSPRDGFKGVRPGTTQRLYAAASTRRRHILPSHLRLLTQRLALQARPRKGDRLDPASVVTVAIRAFQAAGLRPSEWPRAEWTAPGSLELKVRSAKRRQAPQTLPSMAGAAPPTKLPRERVVSIDPEERLWVDLFLGYVARGCAQPGGYHAFYEAMDRKRYDVCQDLGITMTFYAARGQFGADRKKRNGLKAAAVEMGNSPRKASAYYGPVGKARPGVVRPKEHLAEVERVQEVPPSAAFTQGEPADNGFF